VNQRGFILVAVMFAITLVAALAFLLGRGGPMALELAAGESQDRLAARVAGAGMQHALWRADHAGCTGYALASTPFAGHSYSATYSASSGSPVDISVTATLADGASHGLTRRNVAIHQAAVTVDLDAAADSYLDENSPNNNNGNSKSLYVSTNQPSKRQRAALRFGLAGIPLGARIVSASLSLQTKSTSGAAVPIAVRRLTQGWNEGEVTWNARQTGNNWSQAGGDLDIATVSSASAGPAVETRYSWDVTEIVAGWVAGTYDNNGLLLAGADGNANERFYSREEDVASRRPRLSVTYACECGSPCIVPQGTGNVLLVVSNAAALSPSEAYKKALFESWGYVVSPISDDATQTAFNTALGNNDAAYVSESVSNSTLGNKLAATSKGVVYEEGLQNSVLGMATSYGQAVGTSIAIVNNSNAITQPFPTGTLRIYQAAMEGLRATGSLAAGALVLGRWGADAGLAVLNQDAALSGGGTAAGRRVMLPFGRDANLDYRYLNNNGRLIVQRALDWAKAVCSGALRDQFNAISYSGSDGTLSWATDWQEVNESDGPGSGDEIVGFDQGFYQLRVQDNNGGGEGVMRQADLSAYTSATLSFNYRRSGLDDGNDYVAVQVSKNGAAWVEVGRLSGPGSDFFYQSASYDISAYIGASTRIRFISSPTLGNADAVWFDNVQIAVNGCAL
jgi:hypothetical protein